MAAVKEKLKTDDRKYHFYLGINATYVIKKVILQKIANTTDSRFPQVSLFSFR